MSISIGVDLHKTQMTWCVLCDGVEVLETGVFPVSNVGFEHFTGLIRHLQEKGHEVKVAVESTGNARFFRTKVLMTGAKVTVVNTMKFKVINESVNKTDKRDARTLAEFMVQVVMGMLRSKDYTTGYRLMHKYGAMKRHKGSGPSIIARARKISTVIYQMLKKQEDFDPTMMEDSSKYRSMQAAALKAVKKVS